MKILHICNGYCYSKVHANLCQQMDLMVDHQTVYAYISDISKVGSNRFDSKNTSFVYDCILNPFIRKIYPLRVWWTYRHLLKNVNPHEFDALFATTLFSDGGVANKLFKQYGIPYMVSVRATDLTTYLSHSKLLWRYGREVLLNAKKIILVNKVYQEKLRTHEFSRDLWDEIKNKIVIRPNGVDSFWISNVNMDKRENRHSICYVGMFLPRKNVPQLIKAVVSLTDEFPDIQLNIVGAGGAAESEVEELAKQNPNIHFYGPIRDKNKLLDFYRQNDIFAMPSQYETFGLVYTEALTQNLRLLYTKGTGIDGLFDNVGRGIEYPSVENISNALRDIILHYDTFDGNSKIDFSHYDWNVIAGEYVEMFKEIIKK